IEPPAPADTAESAAHRELALLVGELTDQHVEYERAARSWSNGMHERKKLLRQLRADTALRISVILEALGEVERARALERIPFERRIEELYRYVEARR